MCTLWRKTVISGDIRTSGVGSTSKSSKRNLFNFPSPNEISLLDGKFSYMLAWDGMNATDAETGEESVGLEAVPIRTRPALAQLGSVRGTEWHGC